MFFTNYFSNTNNKLSLFSTDLLCGISYLAEPSALLINTLIHLSFVHIVLKKTKRQFMQLAGPDVFKTKILLEYVLHCGTGELGQGEGFLLCVAENVIISILDI